MLKKIQELHDTLPKDYQDLAKLTEHVYEAIDRLVERHVQETANQALAGVKPDREAEERFREDIRAFKQLLLNELEKTTEDILHKGDKHWEKNYKDGVE